MLQMLHMIREQFHVLKIAASQSVKARVSLVERRVKLQTFAIVGYAIAATFIFVAIVGLHIALGFAIAPAVGVPGAIAISSGVAFALACFVAIVGLIFSVLSKHGPGARLKEAQIDAADANLRAVAAPGGMLAKERHRQKAARESAPSGAPKDAAAGGPSGPSNHVLSAVMRKPALAAGGALLALSILGPKRALRFFGPGLAAANFAATAAASAARQRRTAVKPPSSPRVPRPPQQSHPRPPASRPKPTEPNPAAAPTKQPRKPAPANPSRFSRH